MPKAKGIDRRELIATVCRRFCSFYKPGKRRTTVCGTADFLMRNLSPTELRAVARATERLCDFSEDRAIRALACESCDYLVGGCDFRDGLPSPPCGGYPIVEALLKSSSSK